MSKADKIRKIRQEHPNLSAKEIAEKLGIRPQYVHGIIYLDKHKTAKKVEKVVQKPVAKPETKLVPNAEVDALRSEIGSLRSELFQALAVIRYLENKLK